MSIEWNLHAYRKKKSRSRADEFLAEYHVERALIILRILLSGRIDRSHPSSMLANMYRKSHYCPKCSRSYTNKGALSRHLRQECGKMPRHTCRYCLKSFRQRSSFERHAIQIHGISLDILPSLNSRVAVVWPKSRRSQ